MPLLAFCLGSAGAETLFRISYVGVPVPARADFERAARIWSGHLATDVPVRMRVTWIPRGPTGFAMHRVVRNEPYLPRPDLWYPSALANTLAGRRLSEEDDINIFISAQPDWRYSHDPPIAAGQTDFLTVALHEIAHGLGMSSASFVPWQGEQVASFGLPNDYVNYFDYSFTLGEQDGTPFVYDSFIVTADGASVTDTARFPNPSAALYDTLKRDDLRFGGARATHANGGRPPAVAAGNIAHFSAETFPYGSGHYLMTPASGDGRVNHVVDWLVLAVLADLGWPIRAAAAAAPGLLPE